MNKEIVIRDGVEYFKTPNGGLLKINQPNPLLAKFPNHAGVYCITCLNTGKKYIGSSMNLRSRLSSYISNSSKKSGVMQYLDVNKITLDLLEDGKYLKKDQIRQLELEWINKINTIHPNGFNLKCPVTDKYLNEDCYSVRDKPKRHYSKKKRSAYWLDGLENKEDYRITFGRVGGRQ